MTDPRQFIPKTPTAWHQIQSHLKQVIEQAIADRKCPPTWGSFWSESVCVRLLEQMPLQDWLLVTAEDVAQSRGRYFPAKKAGRITYWTPWFIDRPGQGEDDWERARVEQEQAQEAGRQAEIIKEMNG